MYFVFKEHDNIVAAVHTACKLKVFVGTMDLDVTKAVRLCQFDQGHAFNGQ